MADTETDVIPGADSVRITHEADWIAEPVARVIEETCTLAFTGAFPSVRYLDWTTRLTALQDLILDRTPYTTWGGYGGMSFHGSREMHDAGFLAQDDSHVPDRRGTKRQHHDPFRAPRVAVGSQ